MTNIDPTAALRYAAPTDPVLPYPEEEISEKAGIVLDALRAGALQIPFGFDQTEAEPIWAAAIGGFPLEVLTATVGMWIKHHSEFPSLAEFLTIANFNDHERQRAEAHERAKTKLPCPECDDVHFVTIRGEKTIFDTFRNENRIVENRYAVPCRLCLPERYELYQRGHFDESHIDRGGCPECWDYLPTLRHKAKARDGRRA